jgi:SSS family solute:Na+ symporter
MSTLDYGIVIAYMLFALSIGVFFSKKASESSENYFLGGRKLPWWMIGISMVATSFASDTPLVTTEMVRIDGLQKLWWVLISVMALIVGIFLFSRLWRRANIITDAEFYELRYEGNSAAFLRGFRAFFSGVIINLLTMAWVIFGMSTVITILTGLPKVPAVGICVIVALTYATFSGFYGVVVTDFVQFFIATFSMIALAVISVINLGGLENILSTVASLPGYGPETLTIFPDLTTLNSDTIRLLIFVFVFWWNDANGYNMQRMSACRNERDAVLATLFYAIFQTIRPWMWVVVGLASIVMFPTLKEHTNAYPMVMDKFLGPGMRGLLVVAFLAAFMSTIDTQLNWGASYLMIDVYQRFIKKEASQKHYMFVTKIVVVMLMLAGAAIAPLLTSVMAAWEFLTLLMIGSGIFTVLRWFWWRINAYTEITALGLGLIIGFSNFGVVFIAKGQWTFMPDCINNFAVFWKDGILFEVKIAILTAIVVPVSLLVTFMTPQVSKEKLESFYRKVRPGGFWSVLDKDVRNLPGKVLSWSTIIDVAGGMMLCYGLSLAIGFAILMKFTIVAICLVLAVIGAIIVKRWFKKEVRILESIHATVTNS